jgi:hypothetical protein
MAKWLLLDVPDPSVDTSISEGGDVEEDLSNQAINDEDN